MQAQQILTAKLWSSELRKLAANVALIPENIGPIAAAK